MMRLVTRPLARNAHHVRIRPYPAHDVREVHAVTDLDHADMTYEFEFGASRVTGQRIVDQATSAELTEMYRAFQASLDLQGKEKFGTLTADNFGQYMVRYYLAPSAEQYLSGLPPEKRAEYLAKNPWLSWDGKRATFTLAEFASQHVTRFKLAPAFDDFSMSSPETNLFGNQTYRCPWRER